MCSNKKIQFLKKLIGNTPLVSVKNYFSYENTNLILAKLEMYNFSGSIKDRVVIDILENIINSGNSNKLIVEATSGNTGISISSMASKLGLATRIYMPSSKSHMRSAMMKYFSSEVILTDPEILNQHIHLAENYCHQHPNSSIHFNQNGNYLNPLSHYLNLAEEIISSVKKPIDFFVGGFGTGGTLMGVGRRLKEAYPKCRLIQVEPTNDDSCIEGLMKYKEHVYVPSIYDPSLIDEVIMVSDANAISATYQLNTNQGILSGISSGAIYYAASLISKRNKDCNTVCIFPDHLDRYVTTKWFSDYQEQVFLTDKS